MDTQLKDRVAMAGAWRGLQSVLADWGRRSGGKGFISAPRGFEARAAMTVVLRSCWKTPGRPSLA